MGALSLVLRGARRLAFWVIPLATLAVIGAVVVFVLFPAADLWLVWRVYRGYIETVASVTGTNSYLVTALAFGAFVPFYYGVSLILKHPFNSHKRWMGIALLLVLAVAYNVSLYAVTRDMTFGFKSGVAHRFYALTPEGVRFFDRPGFDPDYGVALQAVTPENVSELLLISRGEFRRLDSQGPLLFFNPRTGVPVLWYYQAEDGALEFYNQPGFHPGTGQRLLPVTRDINRKWIATEAARLKAELEATTRRREAEERILRERRPRVERECQKLAAGRDAANPSRVWAFSSMSIYNSSLSVVIDGVRVPCP